jgi:hypothetical protein
MELFPSKPKVQERKSLAPGEARLTDDDAELEFAF